MLGSGNIQYLSEWDWNCEPILSLKQWWNLEFLAIEGFILPLVFCCFFFYRDLLPFTLKLPQAILEARSFQDLEIISSLGIGKSLKAAQVSLRLVKTAMPPTDAMQRWIDKLLSSEQGRKPEYKWEDIRCLYGSTLRGEKRPCHYTWASMQGVRLTLTLHKLRHEFQQLEHRTGGTASEDSLHTLEVDDIRGIWKEENTFAISPLDMCRQCW